MSKTVRWAPSGAAGVGDVESGAAGVGDVASGAAGVGDVESGAAGVGDVGVGRSRVGSSTRIFLLVTAGSCRGFTNTTRSAAHEALGNLMRLRNRPSEFVTSFDRRIETHLMSFFFLAAVAPTPGCLGFPTFER